jgi:hypothetical protein
MQYQKFLLSFAATTFLITPFAINAKPPAAQGNLIVAPASGENAIVVGLNFVSTLVKHDTKTATIHIKAKNDTKKLINAEVAASLMQTPSTSPMARMVPMPREIAQNQLALTLAPGETFTKTITVKLPKHVTEQLQREKLPIPASEDNENQIVLNGMNPVPASFFASVRALPPAPAPSQAKRVAGK